MPGVGGVWNAQACGPEMFFKGDRAIRGSSKWSRGPQGRLLGGSSFDQDLAMDQVHCAWLPLLRATGTSAPQYTSGAQGALRELLRGARLQGRSKGRREMGRRPLAPDAS